ncbi:conserved hypothetical protein [Rhodococcus jostii RHA1]|uniref:Methyltransferase type 11 domain-containing protein n=1 Tax=Rhodococcus jostii (strain RHA1) TaxID=101510 RepID=Q0S1U8_RHOJR|nr:conserved hypothetical protein [Rhodococcus jostii RHA1]
MTSDRRTLRNTFELAAEKYHPARPSYPSALYDELVLTSGLRPGDSLLEIGGGSGKATVELARRGFTITSVELGHELAAIARANVAPFPNAEVVCADFEHWEPAPGMTYDLVFAATSWHWIDPATRYIKAASLIRPGGHLRCGVHNTCSRKVGTRSFERSSPSTRRSAKVSRIPRRGRARVSWPIIRPKSSRAGSSTASWCVTSTGKSATTWTATSTFSTPSPATSPGRNGNGNSCTARFVVELPSGPNAASGGTSVQSCTLPAAATGRFLRIRTAPARSRKRRSRPDRLSITAGERRGLRCRRRTRTGTVAPLPRTVRPPTPEPLHRRPTPHRA